MRKFILTLFVLLNLFRLQAQSQVKFCGKPYSIGHFMLPEQIVKLPRPDTCPQYQGGPDSLKAYFLDKEIDDMAADPLLWKVNIMFKVNCWGQAGDFELMGEPDARLKKASGEVLSAANNIPQKWKAALKDGKPVDCYHVIEFTMVGRSLKNVGLHGLERD